MQLGAFDLLRAVAELVRVVEVGKVATGEALVGIDQRLDNPGVDQVADVAVALERDHVLKAGPFGDDHGRGKVVGVAVFVGNIFDEQHEQDVILVLAGIHAAAQFITGRPERGVEIGFFDGHPSTQLNSKEYVVGSVAHRARKDTGFEKRGQ